MGPLPCEYHGLVFTFDFVISLQPACTRYQNRNAQTFGRRLRALDVHFNNLLNNHSNDDGAQGEDRPRWFNVRQRLAIWQDNQGTRGTRQAAARAQS